MAGRVSSGCLWLRLSTAPLCSAAGRLQPSQNEGAFGAASGIEAVEERGKRDPNPLCAGREIHPPPLRDATPERHFSSHRLNASSPAELILPHVTCKH